MNELLQIRDLTVTFHTYEGPAPALSGLNLDIYRNETLGLVGETGCGKTMTALAILRLIPPPGKIECGSMMFHQNNGPAVDIIALSEAELRAMRGGRVAMIFQEPSAALNPVFNIGDQISEAILLHRREEVVRAAFKTVSGKLDGHGPIAMLGRPVWAAEKSLYAAILRNPKALGPRIVAHIPVARRLFRRLNGEADMLAITALKEVEIPDADRVVRQYPHQLSGGMKQRSVIAMALACRPILLIADEPTTSLDVTIQAQILELLRRLKAEKKSSILYITHDLAVAAQICDRIGVMYSGSLCELGPAEEIFGNPMHPYTKALLAAVPKPGQGPRPIRGFLPDPLNLPPGCRFYSRCDSASGLCGTQSPRMNEVKQGHFVACHVCQGGVNGKSR
jgi:peptide/nickel transport system ATP-binding protein